MKIEEGKYKVKYEGQNKISIEFRTIEEKLLALEQRENLRGTGIWVDDDHTRREIEIQKWLRAVAEREKKKGKEIWVGYQKIKIGEENWRYNERMGELEKKPFRGGEERPRGRNSERRRRGSDL